MKQILHNIGHILAALVSPLKPLVSIIVAISKPLFMITLLIMHYIDYMVHYKSYRKEYYRQKEYIEKLMDDYEKGLVSISIDYPQNQNP